MRRLVGYDVETHQVQSGLLAPPLVCSAIAPWPHLDNARLLTKAASLETLRALLRDKSITIVGGNIAFDFAVSANEDPTLLDELVQAYVEGRVHDILIAQALDAVGRGHLGLMPNGMRLTNSKGKQTKRYSVDLCVRLVLHRYDAKENDLYQKRYAILDRLPQELWPAEARQYPVDDARNEVEVAARQLGVPEHEEAPIIYDAEVLDDGASWAYDPEVDGTPPAPALIPFRNLSDHAAQARAAFALHLGATWGLRSCPLRTELLRMRALELHEVYVKRFAAVGLYRLDDKSEKLWKQHQAELKAQEVAAALAQEIDEDEGEDAGDEPEDGHDTAAARAVEQALLARLGYKRDTAAVAHAVAKAYGAKDPCPRCGGDGRVQKVDQVPCRGRRADCQGVKVEVKGGYAGCLGTPACVCEGKTTVTKKGKLAACRGVRVKASTTYGGCLGTPECVCMGTGVQIKGKYQGCLGNPGCVCGGTGIVDQPGNIIICAVKHNGCGGTGYDIDPQKVPALPRTKTSGVSASRDTLMESGDPDLYDFGHNQQAKILKTYLPFIKRGNDKPLTLKPNVVLETGRTSYEELMQTFPRWKLPGFAPDSPGLAQALALAEAYGDSNVARALLPKADKHGKLKPGWVPSPRECFMARPGRVFGSTDYAALELCALAMVCLRVVGHSKMAEIINMTKQPGHLHSALGAKLLGITFEDMLKRLEAKDKTAKDFRQASKPVNFGLPGGMKAATLVLTSRLENSGETVGPDGRKYAGIRFCILVGGKPQCGARKVTQWKRRTIPPTCFDCLVLAEELLIPSWFAQYPEMQEYFNWVEREVELSGGEIPCFSPNGFWDVSVPREDRRPHRVRGGCGFRDAANNGFQGLAADGAKEAYWEVTRECYTDKRSVLYEARTRAPAFIHDELLTEMDLSLAHLAGLRIEEVMVDVMRRWIPDVHIEAKTALMYAWNKDAEPTYLDGKLVPWVPKEFQ